jgi:hypothetical protein
MKVRILICLINLIFKRLLPHTNSLKGKEISNSFNIYFNRFLKKSERIMLDAIVKWFCSFSEELLAYNLSYYVWNYIYSCWTFFYLITIWYNNWISIKRRFYVQASIQFLYEYSVRNVLVLHGLEGS